MPIIILIITYTHLFDFIFKKNKKQYVYYLVKYFLLCEIDHFGQ